MGDIIEFRLKTAATPPPPPPAQRAFASFGQRDPNPAILEELLAYAMADAYWRGRLDLNLNGDDPAAAVEQARQDWMNWIDYAKAYMEVYWDAVKDD